MTLTPPSIIRHGYTNRFRKRKLYKFLRLKKNCVSHLIMTIIKLNDTHSAIRHPSPVCQSILQEKVIQIPTVEKKLRQSFNHDHYQLHDTHSAIRHPSSVTGMPIDFAREGYTNSYIIYVSTQGFESKMNSNRQR
ncbi:hypothetical protein PILCRDRAFT_827915 [Piloderma croceum F 1598]|uniref:Uncharacterized protein n=1 Tax=Piloderma croceum (strain F 1598) TaxID=765440 RepID=A0A0C3ALE8_PILCF|nr:hypothetical protein PILCRDRAFT_827915 [Piloderma croceum F 1598]